jgi:hypothetical protein
MNALLSTSIFCTKCRCSISWPATLGEAAKSEIAISARLGPVATTVRLQDQFGLPLKEAKAIVAHISREGDICNRCKHAVAKGETVCANCNGANLNW